MNSGLVCPKLSRIMSWMFQYFWILPLCMGTVITLVETEQIKEFAWNKSNKMFNETSEGAVLTIPVGYNFRVICPYMTDPAEYYKVYWVDEQAFRECFRPPNARLLVICNKPNNSSVVFTTEISKFTGVPGTLDFKVGEKYFITTTSTGNLSGIDNQYHGMCTTRNMRMTLTVVEQQTVTTHAPTPTPNTTRTRPSTTPQRNTTVRHTTPSPRPSTTITTPTTTKATTRKVITPDIPDPTEIIINVPDNGNSAVINANSATRLTCISSWHLALALCLSLLHILNLHRHVIVQR